MRLLPSIIIALVNAKPEDRLTALESKLAHLEQLIGTLDATPFDGDCNRLILKFLLVKNRICQVAVHLSG